ncbi:MAG: hypothetical protein NTY77_07675 [Elusimicrobia bacterium]|nr:hypothetical protein [Elusimicrobiota bacterium]
MKPRSRGTAVLSLALWCALPVVSGSAADCPPLPPQAAQTWGLQPESWAKACADGLDPADFLSRVQAEFVGACTDEFQGLDERLVAQECGRGIPGRDHLRAFRTAKTSPPAGGPEQKARYQSTGAEGLQKLHASGLGAGTLEGLYTGAAARPALEAGPGPTQQLAQLPAAKPAPAPKVALGGFVAADPKLSKDEQAFVQALVDRMQDCSEGRAILSGLVTEGQAGKLAFKVTIKDYPGTQIVRKGDIEDIQGGVYGEADTEDHTLYINRALTKFSSRQSAIDNTVGTAAHEMTHLWRSARVQRTLPQYAKVFDADLGDEYDARLKGQLVAAQTHRGKANVDTEDARDMLADADDYRERMKLWNPGYAVSLDVSEMAAPAAAYQSRLKALRTYLQDLKVGQKRQPLILKRIKHFCEAHTEQDYCGGLKELKALTEAKIKTYPHDIKEANEAIKQVQGKLAQLKTAEGRKLAKLLKRAVADPQYQTLRQEEQADLERLRGEEAKSPLPKSQETPDQIDAEGLDALVKGDIQHAQQLR